MKQEEQTSIGRRCWAIAEGYIPAWSNGPEPELQSHETCCVLNAGPVDAQVTLTLYFEDREPQGLALTASPCQPGERATNASTILRAPQQCLGAWASRASSNRMSRWWSSIRDWIRAKPRTPS